jgi:hypothetical protein
VHHLQVHGHLAGQDEELGLDFINLNFGQKNIPTILFPRKHRQISIKHYIQKLIAIVRPLVTTPALYKNYNVTTSLVCDARIFSSALKNALHR